MEVDREQLIMKVVYEDRDVQSAGVVDLVDDLWKPLDGVVESPIVIEIDSTRVVAAPIQ
jgi:hypothetical protein